LHVDRVNENQGAESTLAFLLSLAEMRLEQNAVSTFSQPEPLVRGSPLTATVKQNGDGAGEWRPAAA
jgi:hypothetical protein